MLEGIKTEFPGVKIHQYKGDFTSGFGVEIDKDGKILRNGWVIANETDRDSAETAALIWLRRVSRSD